MFERRLKICLGILLSVMSVLLLRAFHLQVIQKSHFVAEAENFKRKAQYLETTRGRILDMKGHELAIDEACMDACVDYRAITRDAEWMRVVATERAKAGVDNWLKLPRKERQQRTDEAVEGVKKDIDAMFDLLARETGEAPEKIEEACRQIDMRVAMSRRIRQYNRFRDAQQDLEENGESSWYRRWLIDGGKDGPQVDDYADTEGEEVAVHPIVRNISPDAYMRLGLKLPQCPGLSLRPGKTRKYPYGRAGCHLLGTLSTVMREDMAADPNVGVDLLRAYKYNDLVGRSGLEALGEPTLRGVRGKSYRREDGVEEMETAPIAGGDLKTTIDIDLQDQLQRMFEHVDVPVHKALETPKYVNTTMHGAAVVIDIKSGAVRALASYPDYDPNMLSEQFNQLNSDKLTSPMLNRATQSQLDPGSTIKPVVGIAAITKGLMVPGPGVMTAHSGIECTGYLVINGRRMPHGRCWVASKFYETLHGKVAHHPVPGHAPHKGEHGNPNGFLSFADALERSCNIYFETIGDAFGVEALSDWYARFGLGRETGIGLHEMRGMLPRDNPRGAQHSDAWFSAIGQVGVWATPLQMANVSATIARDGTWVRPRLVEDGYTLSPVKPKNGQPIPDRVDLQLSKEAIAAAREGMVRVVNGAAGTGDAAQMTEITVAGKTGTAQAPRLLIEGVDQNGKKIKVPRPTATRERQTDTPWYRGFGDDGNSLNHAWFIGFAPAEKPQVAFAVMVQYGGSGGATAGLLAKKVLNACVEHGHIKVPAK